MKKIIVATILIVSACVNIYLLFGLGSMKQKAKFINREANALISRGDLKGSYELARTITKQFHISRENMCKALEEAAQKFLEQGNKEKYNEALEKLKEQRRLLSL